MNRFFRSALFPLIVIVLLVYLASQTLIPKSKPAKKVTTSDVITRIQTQPQTIDIANFSPGKRQLADHAQGRDEAEGLLPERPGADPRCRAC